MQLNAVESSVVLRSLIERVVVLEAITGINGEPLAAVPGSAPRRRAAKKDGKKASRKRAPKAAANYHHVINRAAIVREAENAARLLGSTKPAQTRRRIPQDPEWVKGGKSRGAKKASKAGEAK